MPGGCRAPETWVRPRAGMEGSIPRGRGSPVGLQHPVQSNTVVFEPSLPGSNKASTYRQRDRDAAVVALFLLGNFPTLPIPSHPIPTEQVPPSAWPWLPSQGAVQAPCSPGGAEGSKCNPAPFQPGAHPPGSWAGSWVWNRPHSSGKAGFSYAPGEAQRWRGEDGAFPSVGFPHEQGKPSSPLGHAEGRGQSSIASDKCQVVPVPKPSWGGRSRVRGAASHPGCSSAGCRGRVGGAGLREPAPPFQGPGTPVGMPRAPRCRATTCPVPSCQSRQRVWDFKVSRLNLELLSSFWGKGLGSAGSLAKLLLPKCLLGTPGAALAPGHWLIQWGVRGVGLGQGPAWQLV